jgi:hypothetical protein
MANELENLNQIQRRYAASKRVLSGLENKYKLLKKVNLKTKEEYLKE